MSNASQHAKAIDPVARLAVLATEINAKLTLARRHGQATLSALMDVGDRLLEAKEALDHGQWDDWLSDNFALSDRTARLYMQLAGHRKRIEAKMATVAVLGVRGALEQISEDQVQEGREKRNHEALARELALRRGRTGPESKPNWIATSGPSSYRSTSYPKPVHCLADLSAERVRRAVSSILMHIETERKWLAQAGLLEQFDAELRRRIELLGPHKASDEEAARADAAAIEQGGDRDGRKRP
jgi:Protein of unknown function (DUF3102)